MRLRLILFLSFCLIFPVQLPAMWNLPFPTLGGKQFWSDEYVYSGWRIQRHLITGHWRLLDHQNIRREWGSRKTCEKKFAEYQAKGTISTPRKDVVILLHGLMRAKESMRRIEKALRAEGYEVVNINYPSYFGKIDRHAAQLDRVIQGLEYAESIHFVTHSMGGIVVRGWLLGHEDERVGRAVMIAPPSQGSGMADFLDQIKVLRVFFGPSGRQLCTPAKGGITRSFGPAPIEVGVIAGRRGNSRGYNGLLDGDDDFIVEVENTRLEGAKDFLLVKHTHTFIMNKDQVIRAVERFLKTGAFQDAASGPTLK